MSETNAETSPIDRIVIRNPHPQIDSWVTNNHTLWQFWKIVVIREDWEGQNKTREEAVALREYYEGRYEMALKFRDFVNQKTMSYKTMTLF